MLRELVQVTEAVRHIEEAQEEQPDLLQTLNKEHLRLDLREITETMPLQQELVQAIQDLREMLHLLHQIMLALTER